MLGNDDATVRVVDHGDEVELETHLPDAFSNAAVGVITGSDLQPVRFVDADFENPDGSVVVLNTDLVGDQKDAIQAYPAGPIAGLRAGRRRTRVW